MTLLDIRAVLLIAGTGTLITAASLYAFHQLRHRPEAAMVSFQLQPDRAAGDYRLLYYANLFQAGVMLCYGTAALLELEAVTNAILTLSVVYGATVAAVFYRWGRRF